MSEYVCVCVCMCVRGSEKEIEREREGGNECERDSAFMCLSFVLRRGIPASHLPQLVSKYLSPKARLVFHLS